MLPYIPEHRTGENLTALPEAQPMAERSIVPARQAGAGS